MTESLSFEETSRFLDTPKGKLHYHVAGDGPPLLPEAEPHPPSSSEAAVRAAPSAGVRRCIRREVIFTGLLWERDNAAAVPGPRQ